MPRHNKVANQIAERMVTRMLTRMDDRAEKSAATHDGRCSEAPGDIYDQLATHMVHGLHLGTHELPGATIPNSTKTTNDDDHMMRRYLCYRMKQKWPEAKRPMTWTEYKENRLEHTLPRVA